MKSRYLIIVLTFWLIQLSVLSNSTQTYGPENNEIGRWFYNSQENLWGNEETGPWVDTIVVESYETEVEMILALIDGDIDACADSVSLDYLDQLDDAEDVELTRIPKNGFGLLNIDCEKYPLNITAFRRALAFALDKESLCQEVWGELAQPHDSCVPSVNHLSNNDQMEGMYYGANLEIAKDLLDDAGFIDIDSDGFREAPNGSKLEISVYNYCLEEYSRKICLIVVNTLYSLSIQANLIDFSQETDYDAQFSNEYDICFIVQNFNTFALDELFIEYLSTSRDNPIRNLPRFVNSTYDTIANQLLHCTNYDKVAMAALDLQKIILYECPIIICYEEIELYAYRTDLFCYDCDYVAADFWRTCYKVYGKYGDVLGGTFAYGAIDRLESMNLISKSKKDWTLLSLSYDSLFGIDINGKLKNRIAYDYKFQNHSDDSSIPLGHCRCKIRIPRLWEWNRWLTSYCI
jgi:ABC-type transport system substrate-binding protein